MAYAVLFSYPLRGVVYYTYEDKKARALLPRYRNKRNTDHD